MLFDRYITQSRTTPFSGAQGLERARRFLDALGNPQEQVAVIHIAGTSGKGSTAFTLASLLLAHGHKVGLHLSPHLIDVRERVMLNGKLLPEESFRKYANQVLAIAETIPQLSYFELLVGIAFYAFAQEKVRYAVMETGLGGTYDATNSVRNSNKIAVLTRIGLDHTHILGSSISEITKQKLGIIQPSNHVIALKQAETLDLIRQVATNQGASLNLVEPPASLPYTLGLQGIFQLENTALALDTLQYLAKRDQWNQQADLVAPCLASLRFSGRFDEQQLGNLPLILDGAHNPQKMVALVKALQVKYPDTRFRFIVAFKASKNYPAMLDTIKPVAETIIATSLTTHGNWRLKSTDPQAITSYLTKHGCNAVHPTTNLEEALQYCIANPQDYPTVCTGSLYLVGEMYELLSKLPLDRP